MKIAVLDSHPKQFELICSLLVSANHIALPFHSTQELSADLLILECPIESGLIERIRRSSNVPILLIAKRFNEDAIVEAMNAGASDYLIKLVRQEELLFRVQALLRRAYPERFVITLQKFGDYAFDAEHRRVQFLGHSVELTHLEFALALLLFNHLEKPLSRTYILDTIWAEDGDFHSRTLDSHISRVRNKLQLIPENGYRLAPVYGYGYRLEQYANSTILK